MPGHHLAEFDFGYDLGIDTPGKMVRILPGQNTGLWIESDVPLVIGTNFIGQGGYTLCSAETADMHNLTDTQTISATPGAQGITLHIRGDNIAIAYDDAQTIEADEKDLEKAGVQLVPDGS